MISGDHVLTITTAPKRDSRHWESGEITWDEFAGLMLTPASSKACGNYVLGRFKPTTVHHPGDKHPCTNLHRSKTAIQSRSALTLDVDYPGADFREKVAALEVAHIIHTTFSSTEEEPRYRLIVPTSRELTPDEYHTAAAALMQQLGEEQFDRGSVQPERYMFLPSERRKGMFWYSVAAGPLANAEKLLEGFQADLSTLPLPRPNRTKRDPFAIEGTIGAFNRAYSDIALAIEDYNLPYEDAGAERWQLVGSSAAAGMGIVAPGLVFSHHANDPAYGQTCSAFDLVRLHLFHIMDENSKPGTPINKLPSTLAMLDLASRDVRVVTELVGLDFDQDMNDIAVATTGDWRLGLRRNSRTGKPTDDIVNWDLISNNDPSFTGLYFNELSLAIETSTDLPWRKLTAGRETFTSGDRSSLALYIERTYDIRPARSYLDDLVNDRALNHRINPVLEYLKGLKWDGVSRIETCLPGVTPTPFTRMAARKSLVAAVARMYQPGVKWDHMLVLYGPEGMGKSRWIDLMSRGYSVNLGRISDKDTLIAMQRAWIMTADEGHSLRKADFDAQKEFLTRTSDVFRMPYEREAQVHKRHMVIWGTTNDEVFLRRQEGNRRFLIVRCQQKANEETLLPEYIDQVWAEAVHLYHRGEQLWLAEEEDQMAAGEREDFTEEDALTGIIQEYVNTPVPDDWDNTSPLDRQMWFMNSRDELEAQGTRRIDEVCSVQIWVEAMGRRYGDHKRSDLLDINNALKQLPGWSALPGRRRSPGYGPQLIFRRNDETDLI